MTDSYTFVSAPDFLSPIDSSVRWEAGMIDYAKHPAYCDYVASATLGQRISALASFGSKFALLLTKRLIRYEMIPYQNRAPRSFGERVGFLTQGLKNMFGAARKAASLSSASAIDIELARNGVAGVVIPDSQLSQLKMLADGHFEALAKRRGHKANRREFDESRSTADPRDSADMIACVAAIFKDSGVLDAASRYVGRELKLVDVNPQINDPSDTFWLDIFPDKDGAPLPRTAYYHRDASGGDLKAIFYYSDVGPNNGPFSYVIGSNTMPISKLDDLLCEANDHNGLASTAPEARRTFAALPAKLRQKGAFGNDLPDDAPLAEAIAKAEWEVVAPAGSIVLFDTKGIHRGGMVQQGERRVITCVLG